MVLLPRAAARSEWVASTIVGFLFVNRLEQIEHRLAVARIEISGRLVGQQQRRPVDDGASDRDALHLAAGQLVRKMPRPLGQADPVEHFMHTLLDVAARDARQRQRERDVLEDIQRRDEIEELKDVADRLAPQHRELSLIERRGLLIAEKNAAARWAVDGADQIQERRFSAAGGAHEHSEFAARDLERDIIENLHRRGFIAAGVNVRDVIESYPHAPRDSTGT